ncbi:hypothetical protein GCM10011418_20700 [Sphingobacterium alkalisoli]|nr:hypothetical protein GCM10011418_20700 [Sphingobacterium alkalisoli]
MDDVPKSIPNNNIIKKSDDATDCIKVFNFNYIYKLILKNKIIEKENYNI